MAGLMAGLTAQLMEDSPLPDNRRLLTLLMVGAVILSITSIDWGGPVFHTGGAGVLGEFISALFPPELSPSFLGLALQATWQTLVFAVAGITVAILLGFPLGVIASGAVFGSGKTAGPPITAARFFLAAVRSIHELVWALLFVPAPRTSSSSPRISANWGCSWRQKQGSASSTT